MCLQLGPLDLKEESTQGCESRSSREQACWLGMATVLRPHSHPDRGPVAVDPGDGQSGRKLQHILQNLFIQLQMGQLTLPFQSAQVDFVRGKILSEPAESDSKTSLFPGHRDKSECCSPSLHDVLLTVVTIFLTTCWEVGGEAGGMATQPSISAFPHKSPLKTES